MLPTADVLRPLGSRTVPDLSYQILTSHNYNSQLTAWLHNCRLTITSTVILGSGSHGTHDHTIRQPTSQNQSHIVTDGQSVSKSWCRAPSGAHDQIVITVWQLRSCFLSGAFSDERTSMSFVHACWSLPAQSFLGTREHILLSQIWDFPFRRLLRLAGSRWRYSTPPPLLTSPRHIAPARITQKTSFSLLHVLSLPGKQRVRRAFPIKRLLYCHLFTRLLFGNGWTCHNML
jgi:hypothetical protein